MEEQTLTFLTHDQMRTIIDRGIGWLKQAQEPNGHFRYEYLPYRDVYLQDDSIVRQAGALYALGEIAKRDVTNHYDLRPYIRRSIAYFESISVKATYNGQEFRAICEPGTRRCKLGATSLALSGMLAVAERRPEVLGWYGDLLGDYLDFILAMKKEDGGFINTFKLRTKTQNTKESSYGNGEATLALARYNRFADMHGMLSPSDRTVRIPYEMFERFNSAAVQFDDMLYLWAMAALKAIHEYDREHIQEYADYALRYTLWRISDAKDTRTSQANFTWIAEGITNAYILLKPIVPAEQLQPLVEEIDYRLAYAKQMQLDPETDKRADRIGNVEQARGGFLTALNWPSQRVDFTQHALTTFMQKLCDIDQQPLVKP